MGSPLPAEGSFRRSLSRLDAPALLSRPSDLNRSETRQYRRVSGAARPSPPGWPCCISSPAPATTSPGVDPQTASGSTRPPPPAATLPTVRTSQPITLHPEAYESLQNLRWFEFYLM